MPEALLHSQIFQEQLISSPVVEEELISVHDAIDSQKGGDSSTLAILPFKMVAAFDAASATEAEAVFRQANLGSRNFIAKHKESFPATLDITSESKCVLALSMGSKHTQGARLDSMLQWISKNFDECTLMAGDYICRLTLQLLDETLTDEEAEAKAVEAIREYQESISPIIAQYSNVCKFHWRPLSQIAMQYKSDFETLYASMSRLYRQESAFRASVRDFMTTYLERVEQDVNDERCQTIALAYLLEECAIFAAMAEHEDTQNFVYSGKIGVMIDLIEGKFKGSPASLNQEKVRFLSVIPDAKGKFFKTGEDKVIETVCPLVQSLEISSSSSSLFDVMDAQMKKKLFKFAKMKRFRVGQTLLNTGDSRKPLIIIEKGRAERFLARSDKTVQRLDMPSCGSTIGATTFLDPEATSPVLVKALDEIEARTLTKKDFAALLEKEPEVAAILLTQLAQLSTTTAIETQLRH